VQDSASQEFLDHLIHHRPKEPLLLLAILTIARFEIFIMLVEYLPHGRISRLSGVIDWREDSHKRSFAEHADKLFL
jgi:hypothetical protein